MRAWHHLYLFYAMAFHVTVPLAIYDGIYLGGMTSKRPGRVGDSPLVGCGLYANDATCAVSATGTGEHFIRGVVAHDIHARMPYRGETLDRAATAVVRGDGAPQTFIYPV